MKKYQKINTEWDLTQLAKNDGDALLQLSEIEEKINEFITKWNNTTNYLKDANVLKQALDEYEFLNRYYTNGGKSSYYIYLKLALKQNDPNVKALENKIQDKVTKIDNALIFFEHSLSQISKDKQNEFLKAPNLKQYKHYLERIFQRSKFLLSEKEEKIINLLSNLAYGKWVDMTEEFISSEIGTVKTKKDEIIKKTFEELISATSDNDDIQRKTAARSLNTIFKKHINVAENEINTVLNYKKIIDELRGYKRPDESRHIKDDIDSNTVDVLINTISNNYEISRRYYTLKTKILGFRKIRYYERNLKYQSNTDNVKVYSYKESFDLVLKVLSNLDDEFGQILLNFNENKFIDVYPQIGKRSGAFCAHHLISQPTYILLNHNGRLRDVLTLAHEVGHGINNELIKKEQNSLHFGTPTSTAEVASTFMEDFVLEELIKNTTKEERLELMISKLDEEMATIFRQLALYQFEQELHTKFRQSGYLDKNQIGNLFKKYMELYLGKSVTIDEDSKNWWIYWSHIRMFFYVYSYASGLLISKSLQNQVKQKKEFIDKVKKFLSTGLSKAPVNIFKEMGIDINKAEFWQTGLNQIEELIIETELLAKKLGKL